MILPSILQLVKVAPFREDFLTTDGTDGTDGKEKKKFGKQELFIREIREIRGSISSVAACRAVILPFSFEDTTRQRQI
jgi:hypothetical protein